MQPKLLLADDSVTIQRVIELTFADEDVQVLAVGDGQQAIDRVKIERPDIVLADVGMPERDGYEVAAFIKGDPELAHIPVLLLTGAFEPVDEARARAVGCDGVLVKPFEPQMVISRVRDLLAGQRGNTGSQTAPTPPAPAAAAAEPAGSLEDYFDRLDAALASKTASTPTLDPVLPEPVPAPARPNLTVVPPPGVQPATTTSHTELDLANWNPPPLDQPVPARPQEIHAAPAAAKKPSVVPAAPPPPQARPAASTPQPAAAAPNAPTPTAGLGPVNLEQAFAALLAAERGQPAPAVAARDTSAREWSGDVPDAVVDAVVSKVLARMGDESMRAAVLDAAERLVREEIDRIKNAR